MILNGRVWRVGDHVSTDEILPGRFMSLTDTAELGRHALEGVRPELAAAVIPGDVLVAGVNFGTGSSRQGAPNALRGAGFAAVVASSFGRIFYRNCLNVGLPALWSPDASVVLAEGDEVEIDVLTGTIVNASSGVRVAVAPLPPFVRAIVGAGGLVAYARERLGQALVPPEN